jgi:hypothetical protein
MCPPHRTSSLGLIARAHDFVGPRAISHEYYWPWVVYHILWDSPLTTTTARIIFRGTDCDVVVFVARGQMR